MSRILLAGSDFRLLETRAAVLAKTGAEVISRNAKETLRILDREKFDLVILCHSLPEPDAALIVAKIHEKRPGTKILMVASNLDMYGMRPDGDVDATSLPEPGHLVALASQLLKVTSRGASMRAHDTHVAVE
jgi:DNA-binding NtrC family response regulator